MNITLSLDEDTIRKARQKAEVLGTTINQLVREHLEYIAGVSDATADAAEFERLSAQPQGDSRGWKFDRDELHQR